MRLSILWEKLHHRRGILAIFQENPERLRLATLNLHDFDLDGGIKFSEKITRMANRGVRVTILLGENPYEMAEKSRRRPVYGDYLKALKKIVDTPRVNAYWHPRIHAKLLLIEREHFAGAIVTSANFTPTGLSVGIEGNREVGCYLSNLDETTHRALREATNQMIELARGNPLKRDLEQILGSGRDMNVV